MWQQVENDVQKLLNALDGVERERFAEREAERKAREGEKLREMQAQARQRTEQVLQFHV